MAEGEQSQQGGVPVDIALLAEVVSVSFKDVEDVEGVTDGLSVEQDITGEAGDSPADELGQSGDKSPAVDADDVVSLSADEEAAAVVFFLEAVLGVGQEAGHFAFLDGVEELAVGAGALVFRVCADVGRAVLSGGVSLRLLGGDELVEDGVGLLPGDGLRCLGASL